MKTKILLIWQEIPERTRLYVFDADGEMMTWLLKCHRIYINHNVEMAEQLRAMDKLVAFLDTQVALVTKAPVLVPDSLVIISGWVV